MRIGVNTLPLFPGQIGGMETYTVNLLTHLTAIDRQHTYYLFVTHYNRDLFKALSQRPNVMRVNTLSLQGLRYAERGVARVAGPVRRTLPRLSRWLGNAIASAHMLAGIRRHKIDLWFCPLINLAPRHCRLPCVVSIPDLQPEFYPDFFRKDLLEWRRRDLQASCRNATKVVTLSEFSKTTIVERYHVPADKVHAIPLAVGDEFLLPKDDAAREAVRANYALPPEYGFYPANTWPHKNHTTLLKALHLLSEKHGKRLACVFTGVERGGHEALLKATEELDLRGQICLLGYVEKEDMPLLYRGASLLIFSSLFEGFGLPLLEAMASDCPVVCSNATSIPEVVGDAALLCDPHDPEAIADAIHRILTDGGLRRALVQAGRERCRHFSWERTARETLKVLEEAASIGAQQ
ncbi:glycosyltransferase family 1 protein [Candidatus Methylomirabilis sp.]|uniref:glycosyltransferase family 4 protein n=1 Tax=Candidatus Methylomirabilis sp. TaxID=2032687 RepID=UPI002A600CC8|nr:glycosyltransferase family 1 protein [Candidatus Methylomirabilis sp.]